MLRPLFAAYILAGTLAAGQPKVEEAPLRAHLSFLSDDLLEGRGTGNRGGRLAARYLETQAQALGLRPAKGGSYLQAVKLQGIRTLPEATRVVFSGASGDFAFQLEKDFVLGSGGPVEAQLVDAPLIFVGHGITLENRDDFKGVDVRGKILVALVGDRPEQRNTCCTPAHYAGRWTYKVREAWRRGAAGILLLHETARAGYGWDVVQAGWNGERIYPDSAPQGPGIQGWISEPMARALFRTSGEDFEAQCRKADGADFRPVPLHLRLRGSLRSAIRRFEDANIAGILPGTDPALSRELVVYSAHWDHLGLDPKTGQAFNGAVDNASGCAGALAIAQALQGRPGRRSQMFLFTCAEEHGLLGAEAFVADPLWPLDKIVAVLNLESLNFAGPTLDIGLAGSEGTTLHELAVKVAAGMGLVVAPSAADPQALFFRADHFPFVKRGVPAFSPGFSLDGGWDYLKTEDAAKAKGFVLHHYHQISDRYEPAWDLRGMLQQLQFVLALGQELAEGAPRPVWKQPAQVW